MTDLRKLLDEATKGPWCDGMNMICKRGEVGLARWIVQKMWDDEQGKADARLIAMAPDLAAALLKAEEALRDATNALEGFVDTGAKLGAPYEHPLSAYDRARATLTEIRKLTGGV